MKLADLQVLTPQAKNELLATKVMEWKKSLGRAEPSGELVELWVDSRDNVQMTVNDESTYGTLPAQWNPICEEEHAIWALDKFTIRDYYIHSSYYDGRLTFVTIGDDDLHQCDNAFMEGDLYQTLPESIVDAMLFHLSDEHEKLVEAREAEKARTVHPVTGRCTATEPSISNPPREATVGADPGKAGGDMLAVTYKGKSVTHLLRKYALFYVDANTVDTPNGEMYGQSSPLHCFIAPVINQLQHCQNPPDCAGSAVIADIVEQIFRGEHPVFDTYIDAQEHYIK